MTTPIYILYVYRSKMCHHPLCRWESSRNSVRAPVVITYTDDGWQGAYCYRKMFSYNFSFLLFNLYSSLTLIRFNGDALHYSVYILVAPVIARKLEKTISTTNPVVSVYNSRNIQYIFTNFEICLSLARCRHYSFHIQVERARSGSLHHSNPSN